MKIISTAKALLEYRNQIDGKLKIGFVPTMGALHDGHLSLIKNAAEKCDIIIVSIFVNPLQFNNPNDLKNYPRVLEKDILLLQQTKCNAVFIPESEKEIYNSGIEPDTIDLTYLNSILEGPKRPGHFEGVVSVVSILFKLIEPHYAFFGLKDFQQVKVIEQLVKDKHFPITIVPCATEREQSGLAMSSRNMLLSKEEKQTASHIYQILLQAKVLYHQKTSLSDIYTAIHNEIKKTSDFKLDYFEIRNSSDLSEIKNHEKGAVALIAVHLGKVRLIDNLLL